MGTTFFTSLTEGELSSLIEASVQKALNASPVSSAADETDTLLDTKEAAQLIKYKEASIYGLVKRRKIPFCKVEGKLLFSKKKLLDWILTNPE